MKQTHWDVEWDARKEKWAVIKHTKQGQRFQHHRKTRKQAVKKAEGLATTYLRNQPGHVYSSEVHIYNKGGQQPTRIKKVTI